MNNQENNPLDDFLSFDEDELFEPLDVSETEVSSEISTEEQSSQIQDSETPNAQKRQVSRFTQEQQEPQATQVAEETQESTAPIPVTPTTVQVPTLKPMSAPTPATAPKQAPTPPPANPFEAAMAQAQADSDKRLADIFQSTQPIFSYANCKESIADSEKTFDELRAQYETDFPELSEKKKVSWTVSYGKVTKTVTKPEVEKIYDVKNDIENSKQFLDGIKNAKNDKERKPECLVTPKVIAQSKGKFPSYKGMYPNMASALADNKPIMFVPDKAGGMYEIRCNDIGTFVTPADIPPEEVFQADATSNEQADTLSPSFIFKLPKIPFSLLHSVITFFRECAYWDLEVMVYILYDPKTNAYHIHVPTQYVSEDSIEVRLSEDDLKNTDEYVHIMDIHSHHKMSAKFSEVDNKDETATRLYGVIGRTNMFFPELNVRMSNGGKFHEIDPVDIFETSYDCFSGMFNNMLQQGKSNIFIQGGGHIEFL